jgi:hypothetical protein
MFKKINECEFKNEFKAMGRAEQFSSEALGLLFDYLENLEYCEEPYELDVIALCCDFAESDPYELIESYDIDVSDIDVSEGQVEDDELVPEIQTRIREYLEENTVLVGETDSGSFVYHQF